MPAALALACADDIEPPAATGTPPPPAGGKTSSGSGVTDATADTGHATTMDSADETAGASMREVCEGCATQANGEGFCAAPHIPGVTDPERLQWSCSETCVAVGDTARWCGDDMACCEGPCDEFGRCGVTAQSSGSTGGSGGTAGSDTNKRTDTGTTSSTG